MQAKLSCLVVLLGLLAVAGIAGAATTEIVIHTARGQFEEVKERVMLAIELCIVPETRRDRLRAIDQDAARGGRADGRHRARLAALKSGEQ